MKHGQKKASYRSALWQIKMILNDVTKLPASFAFINIYICDARGTKIAIDMGTIFILDLLEFSKWPKILFFENFFL